MRVLILISLLAFSTQAQINFFEEYAGNGNDFGQGVVQLPDSSYVITGASSSFSGFQTDAFLLCIDSMGQYKWSTYFGGEESDWGRRVMYAPNEGFYVAGYSNSDPLKGFDYYLVKTGLNGVPQWQKRYGSDGWEKVHDAALTRDTGVIMVGETDQGTASGKDIYVVRTNSAGDTLWTKTIGGVGEDMATSIDQWNDSVFVLAGKIYVQDSAMHKGFLYCFKDDGTTLWMDSLGTSGNYFYNQVIIRDDTLQGVGGHRMDDNDDWDTWRMSYLLLPQTMFYDINEHNEDDYIAEGLAIYGWDDTRIMPHSRRGAVTFPGGEDLHFAKQNIYMFTMNSNACWVARDGQDELGQIISTSDGGVMAVGYTSSRVGVASNWVYALKIGPNDYYPWQDEVGPVLPLVGQKELLALEGISIYPNPTVGELTIHTNNNSDLIGQIFTLSGQLIETFEISGTQVLDLSHYGSGVYLLRLNDSSTGATYTDRIIKN